jgi:hypothetical protein
MAIINNTWLVKLLGRRRHGYEYDFPYVLVMVAGAVAAYYLFRAAPQIEKMFKTVYP